MDHPNRTPSSVLRSRALRGTAALIASALALFGATSANAALREYRVHFEPSGSSAAVGYTMHVGLESGTYQQDFDLGAPPVEGGTIVYAMDLEDSVDLFVALRAYDEDGSQSAPSNEVRVEAMPAPPPPDDGGTDSGGSSTGSDPVDTGTGDSGTGSDPVDSGTGDSGTGSDPGGDVNVEPPPVELRAEVGLGIVAESGGLISTVLSNGGLDFLTMDSLADPGDVRPVRCDFDGDGDRDLVLGFGNGSAGQIALITMEEGAVASVTSIESGTAAYHARSGETNPACGDMDGDGRAELVIGFGSLMRGVVQVFDDVQTGFAPRVGGPMDADGYLTFAVPEEKGRFKGEVHPAIGDVDGDGRGELFLGLGRTENAAYLVTLDDMGADFAVHPGNRTGKAWLEILISNRRSTDRFVVRPSLGDIDGDGRDEIALSFGRGSGARIAILNDAIDGFPRSTSEVLMISAGRADYQRRDGETRSAMGDVDDDGIDELIVGFMRAGSHEVQIFDDLGAVLRPMITSDGFVSAGVTASGILPAPSH